MENKPPFFTQARCHVDLAALVRNFRRCGAPEHAMPVVKSDAYGHGLAEVVRSLSQAGATRFAVGCVDEGRYLRELGYGQEILPLMPPSCEDDWAKVAAHGLVPLVCTFQGLERAASLGSAERPLPVAVKLETGMHRLGFRRIELPGLMDRLRSTPSVTPVMAVSHCSCADIPEKKFHTAAQILSFSEMTEALRSVFPGIRRSLFNSAGELDRDSACGICDVTRPGIVLYGGNPFAGTTQEHLGADFEWVMSLSTVVLQTTELKKGEAVSYGQLFVADRDMRLAVVGAGYATGVPRSLSGRFSILAHGRRAPGVGRVCMNMAMFDVTRIPGVRAGDEVWLLGGDPAPGETATTPYEWAERTGTIPYEILCIVGSLNPRVYHG